MWHWMKSYFFGFAEMFPCDLSYSECVSPSLVKAALAQSDPESCILQEYKKCILFKTGSSYSNLHFQTISILFFFFCSDVFVRFILQNSLLLRDSVAHHFKHLFFKFNPTNTWNRTKILEKDFFSELKYWAFQVAALFYAMNICSD